MTQQPNIAAAHRLALARMGLRRRLPYMAAAIQNMIPYEVPGYGTLGITATWVLFYDPEVVLALPQEQLEGVLFHEALHVLNKHHARQDGRDHERWNIAGDLSINDIAVNANLKLPKGAIMPSRFGLPGGHTVESYFNALPDDAEQSLKDEDDKREQGKDGKNDGQDAQGSPQQGGDKGTDQQPDQPGAGGQAEKPGRQGHEQPGRSGTAGSSKDGPGTGSGGTNPAAKRGLCRGWCGSGAGRPMPDEPQAPQGRTPGEGERIRQRVAQAVKDQAQRGRGLLPGALTRWADDVLAPPRIRWQEKFAHLVRHAVGFRPGAVDHRYSRISRRQWGCGLGIGRPMMPALVQPRPNVAFVMDTSGSMGTEETDDGMREGNGILQAVGADVLWATCDAKVHGIKRVRTWQEARALLHGGGGTDMRPAFVALMNERPRPEVIIVATDGLVGDGVPAGPPPGVKVIWLLLGKNQKRPCTWGDFVEVKP